MNIETNILLPSASIDVFVTDSETLDAARQLENDWRFTRVKINVQQGDVTTAIEFYKKNKSPNLVLVETATTDESFIKQLGVLSGRCDEGTNAVVIGPVNDVNLYRDLTSMGVSDYLVKSVSVETLSEVIAKTLIKNLGISGSRLVGVIGSKGGVGVSAMIQALAWGLAEKMDQKTFLMDAAGGWSSLSVGMGFEPLTTLHEAIKANEGGNSDSLNRMIFKAHEKLSVLASGSDTMLETSIQAPDYEDLINEMMKSHPIVLVDLSSAIPSLKRTVLNQAHEIIVVTTPTLSALRSTRSLLQEIKLLHDGDLSAVDLIVNMTGIASGKEVPNKDIEAALNYKPSLTLPFDPKLFVAAENEGRKLSSLSAGSEIVTKLLPIVNRVTGGNLESPKSDNLGLLDKVLGSLKGKG